MISELRSYINESVLLCDADYKEIRDPFGSDDLSLARIDTHYKFIVGDDSAFVDGNYHGDTFACSLEIYKKSGVDEITDFDNLYDLALDVKAEIINPLRVKNNDCFTDIEITSLTPESLPSNDKVFRIIINLQVRRDFDYRS